MFFKSFVGICACLFVCVCVFVLKWGWGRRAVLSGVRASCHDFKNYFSGGGGGVVGWSNTSSESKA